MNNQLAAYFDENNQKKFKSQKAKIVRYLKDNPNRSRFSTGDHLGISSHASQKRLSDLVNEGTIKVTGNRKHGDNTISLYSLTEQLHLFSIPKKPSLSKFLKENYPHILFEYKARFNHEL